MQIKLHDQSEYIHSAAELHRRVDEIKKYDKQVQLSEFYHF